MQKRTSPLKFGDLAEKSGLNSVSNLSTKPRTRSVGSAVGAVDPRNVGTAPTSAAAKEAPSRMSAGAATTSAPACELSHATGAGGAVPAPSPATSSDRRAATAAARTCTGAGALGEN